MIGSLFSVDEQMQMGLYMFSKAISALTNTEFILKTSRSQDKLLKVASVLTTYVTASALPGAASGLGVS